MPLYGLNVCGDILHAEYLRTPHEDYNVERGRELLVHVGHSCFRTSLRMEDEQIVRVDCALN